MGDFRERFLRWLIYSILWLIDRKMASYKPVRLYEPISYVTATCDEKRRVCNGCGSAQAKFDFVPDSIYGLKITPACNIHDWMYHKGKTLADKEEADRVFLNNMLRLIEGSTSFFGKRKFIKRRRRVRAKVYYECVRWWGGPAYWEGKN